MPNRQPDPGILLILAPTGRDADGARVLLERESIKCRVCRDLDSLCDVIAAENDSTLGAVLIADEALANADRSRLSALLNAQPPWSDLPFVVLTHSTAASRRSLPTMRLPQTLGNVMYLERPSNTLTLISVVKAALRARQRQRQVRAHLEERQAAAEALEAHVAKRTADLEIANARLRAEVSKRERAQAALAQAQKMEAVGQLTGGIAHDFNNLLQVISGNLELMRARAILDDRLLRLARNASVAADRAARLTGQLLAFSRIQKIELKAVDVNGLIDGMREMLDRSLGAEVIVRLVPDPKVDAAMGDANQLELAVLNLAINARDAMPSGGTVTITTEETVIDNSGDLMPGDYIVVSVSDTGSGMPPGIVSRAFDPFFTTKATGHGTGLGLSQVYGIARQSGGTATIQSAVGRGTTVRIFLPRAMEDAQTASRVPASVQSEIAPIGRSGGPRRTILVIDDDPDVRRFLADTIEALGYAVLKAPDGPSGLELLQKNRPDLLLVDYSMPGMNGAEVARAVRARRSDLPILFASGYADTAIVDAALGSEARVLRKPFIIGELAAALDHALDGEETASRV
jgi:signal transduction histidine kinase/ActR/RegA family two-component response regulator